MFKKIRWFVFVAVALASGSTVAAVQGGGTRSPGDVTIVQDSKIPGLWTASGALGAVRYETPGTALPTTPTNPIDIKKYIGCGVEIDLQGVLATCWAYKALVGPPYTVPVAQDSVQCTSDNPSFVAVVASLKGDSMLTFSLVRTSALGLDPATCTSISVENSSQHYPKMP